MIVKRMEISSELETEPFDVGIFAYEADKCTANTMSSDDYASLRSSACSYGLSSIYASYSSQQLSRLFETLQEKVLPPFRISEAGETPRRH